MIALAACKTNPARMPPTRYKYHTIPYPAAASACIVKSPLLAALLQDVAT